MEIAVYAGAHLTGYDLVTRCLAENARNFLRNGTYVPDIRRYKMYVAEVLELGAAAAKWEWSEVSDDPDVTQNHSRMLLASESFFGMPRLAARHGLFYKQASDRLRGFMTLTDVQALDCYLVIRNPATFLPELFENTSANNFMNMIGGADPNQFKWSELLERLSQDCPKVTFHVYCYEDLPLIWSEFIRHLGDLEPTAPLKGEFQFAQSLMNKTGMTRYMGYLRDNPNFNEAQKRRALAAFLNKYALEDEIEQNISIPGWSDATIDELTEQYEEDLYHLERLPNVNFVTA